MLSYSLTYPCRQDDIPQESELFTAYLGSWRDQNDPDKGESFYTFGYIDQDVVAASGQDIYYTPVDNSQGFWQFQSTSASVNGKVIKRSGNTAIADTGTTLALVDDAVCEAIYSAIPGAHQSRQAQVSSYAAIISKLLAEIRIGLHLPVLYDRGASSDGPVCRRG